MGEQRQADTRDGASDGMTEEGSAAKALHWAAEWYPLAQATMERVLSLVFPWWDWLHRTLRLNIPGPRPPSASLATRSPAITRYGAPSSCLFGSSAMTGAGLKARWW